MMVAMLEYNKSPAAFMMCFSFFFLSKIQLGDSLWGILKAYMVVLSLRLASESAKRDTMALS